jgi:hypothetical protein
MGQQAREVKIRNCAEVAGHAEVGGDWGWPLVVQWTRCRQRVKDEDGDVAQEL